MRFSPRPYTTRVVEHILRHPKAAIVVDMGLGKTAMVLTALVHLQDTLDVSAALVVAPKRVAVDTWREEVAKWDHTRHLRVSVITGDEGQRIAAINAKADIYTVGYHNLAWLDLWLSGMRAPPWNMIVHDESSKMKEHSTTRFKLWRAHAARADRVLNLTGTPSPMSLMNLWSQYYLLDQGARLGRTISMFRDRFFERVGEGYFTWRIRSKEASRQIEQLVADVTVSLSGDDHVSLPPLVINDVRVRLPPKAQRHYDELQAEMLTVIRRATIVAPNPALVSAKCRQLLSGAVYSETGYEVVHNAKLEALDDIIDEMNGKPMMVVYEYKHERDRLLARHPMPWVGGGSKDPEGVLRQWNAGQLPLMAVHAASVGHGLNLQHGGSAMVFLTVPWSTELYHQMIKRLHRSGQTERVVVHRLIVPNTVDTAVVAALRKRGNAQAAFMQALQALGETL